MSTSAQAIDVHQPFGLELNWRRSRVSHVYQNEIAECGIACLVMICGYHGYRIDLRTLRARFPSTLQGATLTQLVNAARHLNLSARAIKIAVDDLKHVRVPAILHWELNHYVVLTRCSKRWLEICDPARGVRRIPRATAGKYFTGIALELTPTAQFKRKDESQTLGVGTFFESTKGLGRSLAQIVILSVVLQALGLAMPYYTQVVVDQVLVGRDEDFLLVASVGALVLAITTSLLRVARTWTGIYFQNIYRLQLSQSLLAHMIRLPLAWFEGRHVGDILSRFGSVHTIQGSLVGGLISGVLNVLTAATTLLVMVSYSQKLTAVTLLGAFGYLTLRALFYYPLRAAKQDAVVVAAEESTNFLEVIKTVSSIKMAAKEESRLSQWSDKVVNTMNADLKLSKYSLLFQVCRTAIVTAENVTTLWIGALTVLAGSLSMGMLFAYMAWRVQFIGSVYGLVNGYFSYKLLGVDFERLSDIALEEKEEQPRESDTHLSPAVARGDIELNNVSYRFGADSPWLFHRLNLTIHQGEFVALVGPSGAGKTTLLKLLCGLIRPSEGEITIGGIGMAAIGYRNYRAGCGVVMQGDNLSSGTIESNVALLEDEIDEARLVESCRQACILEEIQAKPMGLKSLVGDLGSMLSGGQRQRVLLARAFYRAPHILYLDEAMSNLDGPLEARIMENLQKMDCTRVVITHRRDVLKYVDRVIDLSDLCAG